MTTTQDPEDGVVVERVRRSRGMLVTTFTVFVRGERVAADKVPGDVTATNHFFCDADRLVVLDRSANAVRLLVLPKFADLKFD